MIGTLCWVLLFRLQIEETACKVLEGRPAGNTSILTTALLQTALQSLRLRYMEPHTEHQAIC